MAVIKDREARLACANYIIRSSCLIAVLCFIPLFAPYNAPPAPTAAPTDSANNVATMHDDYSYLVSYYHIPIFNLAGISPLIIALLPAIDMILDVLPLWLTSPFTSYEEERVRQDQTQALSVPKLSRQCRAMFIVGIISLSVSIYPALQQASNATTMYLSFENVSTVFTICPLISFATRHATSWAPWKSVVVVSLVQAASFISSLALCLDPTSATVTRMNTAACSLVDIAAGLFVVNNLYALGQTAQWEWGKRGGALPGASSGRGTSDSLKKIEDMRQERFNNLVIAGHLLTAMCEFGLNSVWYWYRCVVCGYHVCSLCIRPLNDHPGPLNPTAHFCLAATCSRHTSWRSSSSSWSPPAASCFASKPASAKTKWPGPFSSFSTARKG